MALTQEQYKTALGITKMLKVNSFLQCKVCNEILFSASGFLEHKLRICGETIVDVDKIGKPEKNVHTILFQPKCISGKQLTKLDKGLKSKMTVRIKVNECPISQQTWNEEKIKKPCCSKNITCNIGKTMSVDNKNDQASAKKKISKPNTCSKGH